jgi:tRNA (cmo5U34)-methyltransferase
MTIKALFDKAAQTYNQSRRQFIPCFDDFYGTVLDLIAYYQADAPLRVLDLGAGTGLLSAFIAEAFPNAQFRLVDISEEMLNQAEERFAAQGGRFEFELMDYVNAPLGEAYDLIVSGLSIHHLSDVEKPLLFQKIYHALSAGGIFINADQVHAPTAAIDQVYREIWLRQIRQNGITESQLAAASERMKADKLSPLALQLDWLTQIGFQEVNCWYKHYSFVVYSARKA